MERLDALQIRIEVLPQSVRIGDDVGAPDAVPPRFVAQVGFDLLARAVWFVDSEFSGHSRPVERDEAVTAFHGKVGTDTPHAVARLPLVREAVEDGVVVGELVCVALVFPFAEQ